MFVCWILTFSSWGWNATIFGPVVPLTHNFAFHRCLFHCRMREQSSCEAWASCLASCSVLEWRLCISSFMKFLRIRLHQKSYIPWPLPLRWGHLPSIPHSCGHQIMTGSAFWVSTPFMSFGKMRLLVSCITRHALLLASSLPDGPISMQISLNLCTMTACGFLNMGIVKAAASLASPEEQAHFLARCKKFAQNYVQGDRPPHPPRTFNSCWAGRCERDWKLAFTTFTLGQPWWSSPDR